MRYTDEKLTAIYDKTNGYCHLCHRKLSYPNYGVQGMRGCWHVEHSTPKCNGGSDHLNNLYAACINCNLEKGTLHTKTIRSRNKLSRAPYSRNKRERIREENTVGGMIAGGLAGASIGPVGIIVGAIFGGLLGEELTPWK
jgi:hypothetical protein